VLSEPLKERPDPGVLARLRTHGETLCTAAPVWHELVFGCQRIPSGAKRDLIGRYLEEVVEATIPILPYDRAAARRHGEERR
jgi:tRNA(fMet)-specific endonuclease VapC